MIVLRSSLIFSLLFDKKIWGWVVLLRIGQITIVLLLFYHRDAGYEPISRARTAQDCFITPRCHGHIKINNNILIPTCLGALSEWGVKENVVKWCKNRLAYKEKGVYNRRAATNLYDGQVQKDRGEKWNTQNRPFVWAQNESRFACPYFILGLMLIFPSRLLSFSVTGRALLSNR